jgi:alpha-L-fucosidase
MRLFFALLLACFTVAPFLRAADHPVSAIQDTETKDQRDARMAWWRDARFGMFIHWGLYAIPAGKWKGRSVDTAGEWIMNRARIPVADYQPLASQFDPTLFDADAWVAVAKAAGMKYIVITAKHHDGFAMFKSDANPFNIVDATPFKRDPLQELAAACRKQGIKLGFYYSQDQDWTAPGAAAMGGHWDKAQNGDFAEYLQTKAIPQIKELLENYGDFPAVLWFDTPTREMTPDLAAQIVQVLNQHPNLIWNNRLGGGYQGDTETPEQRIPPGGFPGKDWETCMTINDTWGYKSADKNWKSTATLLDNLIDIASKGGNYLLNIGPDAQGLIPQPEVDRLKAVGKWLEVNGEAIYGTHAGPFPETPRWGRITQKGNRLYLHVFDWPQDGQLVLPVKNTVTKAFLLASPDRPLQTIAGDTDVAIKLPAAAPDPIASVIAVDLDGPAVVLPPPPITQKNDGSLFLEADQVKFMKDGGGQPTVRLQGEPPNIGYWIHGEDYAQWTVQISKPEAFEVSLSYAASASPQGIELTLSAGNQSLPISLKPTAGWGSYQTARVGDLSIATAGTVTLTLKRGSNDKGACNLRNISLKPVSP